jgi:hypothetical protein
MEGNEVKVKEKEGITRIKNGGRKEENEEKERDEKNKE